VPTDSNGTAVFHVPNGTYVAQLNDTALPPATTVAGPEFSPEGTSTPVTVAPGDFYPLGAPVQDTGSITGTVWADSNGDGNQNGTQSGIEGVVVQVVDTSNPDTPACTATTDSSGQYACDKLPLNTDYNVQPSTPYDAPEFSGPGVDSTTGVAGPITLTPDNPDQTVNFGVLTTPSTASTGFGTIEGTVWVDSNNNTIKDSNETGLPDVVVNITTTNGTVVATTTTDQYGYYSFTIEIDIYIIIIVNPNPSNYEFVSTPSDDNNVDSYGASQPVDLGSGDTPTVNGGLVPNEGVKATSCTSNDVSADCLQYGSTGVFRR